MENKVKIAFYIESMAVGGAEKVLLDMVNLLDPEKYDITVISLFAQSVYSNYTFKFDEYFKQHVHYRTCVDNSKKWIYILFNYLFAHLPKKWIYKILIKENFDVEIAFYEGMPTIFVSNSTNIKSKKIAWLHTNQKRLYENKSKKELQCIQKMYKHYNLIVGVSQAVQNSFYQFFPFCNLTYCYNPLDEKAIWKKAEEKSEIQLDESVLNLVTIGRMVDIKGYDRLLSCVEKLRNRNFHLWMIGEGYLLEKLKKYVIENSLEEKVSFLGHQTNPYKYLKQMDYLICSSYEEGLSTVVIEALLLHIPVITTDCTGMREIFGNTQSGIICENSKKGLLEAIRFVLNYPEKYDYYKEQAKKRGRAFYASERLKSVEEILDGPIN